MFSSSSRWFISFSNDKMDDSFAVYDWPDEFTFLRNLGTVTIQDRVAVINLDGSWTVFYQNPRTAQIADDGTLVHHITDHCYFAYKDVFAFLTRQDNSQKDLAFNEPLSFSALL